jgi:hypothetical protein
MQRAYYGIPPLTLDQSLLRPECDLQNHQIASPKTAWSTTSSPWDDAPWHEAYLYDPRLVSASYGEYDNFSSTDPSFQGGPGTWACMWFRQDEEFHPEQPVTFYWASEASGPSAVPPTMSAAEWPATPAEEVGLPDPTGPNLIFYATQPYHSYTRIEPTGATVMTASGESLPVHVAGEEGEGHEGIIVIDKPVQPLASFQVAVTWEVARYRMAPYTSTQTFSVTTGAAPPPELPVEEVHHSAPPHPHRSHPRRPERVLPTRLKLGVRGSTIRISGSRVLRGHRLEVMISRTWVPCAVDRSDRRCTWVRKGRPLRLHRRMTRLVRLHFRAPGPWERVAILAGTRGFKSHGHRYSEARVHGRVEGRRQSTPLVDRRPPSSVVASRMGSGRAVGAHGRLFWLIDVQPPCRCGSLVSRCKTRPRCSASSRRGGFRAACG